MLHYDVMHVYILFSQLIVFECAFDEDLLDENDLIDSVQSVIQIEIVSVHLVLLA